MKKLYYMLRLRATDGEAMIYTNFLLRRQIKGCMRSGLCKVAFVVSRHN